MCELTGSGLNHRPDEEGIKTTQAQVSSLAQITMIFGLYDYLSVPYNKRQS